MAPLKRKIERIPFWVKVLSLVFWYSQPVLAGEFDVEKEISWQKVKGATGYEVRFVPVEEEKDFLESLTFKIKNEEWKGKIPPGSYMFSLRSYDRRGVPGDWSQARRLDVPFPIAALIKPANNALIKSNETDEAVVTFKWKMMAANANYRLSIINEKGESVLNKVIEDKTEHKVDLPVAQNFQWSLQTISKAGLEGQKMAEKWKFTIRGGRLSKPELKDEFVYTESEEVVWELPKHADSFDYFLKYRENRKGKKYKTIQKKMKTKDTSVLIDKEKYPGDMLLKVRSKGNLRLSSKFLNYRFSTLKPVDRFMYSNFLFYGNYDAFAGARLNVVKNTNLEQTPNEFVSSTGLIRLGGIYRLSEMFSRFELNYFDRHSETELKFSQKDDDDNIVAVTIPYEHDLSRFGFEAGIGYRIWGASIQAVLGYLSIKDSVYLHNLDTFIFDLRKTEGGSLRLGWSLDYDINRAHYLSVTGSQSISNSFPSQYSNVAESSFELMYLNKMFDSNVFMSYRYMKETFVRTLNYSGYLEHDIATDIYSVGIGLGYTFHTGNYQ